MTLKIRLAVLLASVLLLASCSGSDPGAHVPEAKMTERSMPASEMENSEAPPGSALETIGPPATEESQTKATTGPQIQDTASASVFNTKYRLNAILDYDRHHVSVEEQIHYTNPSQETLDNLLLIVEPSRYPDVFHLKSITVDGQAVDYVREIGQILIDLSSPLTPYGNIEIYLDFELNLPSPDSDYYGRPVPFGYSPRQTNLVDWYPFLPPYVDGEGWLAHQAGFFGEHLVYEVADFDVSIQIENTNQALQIAASAPAEKEGNTYHYKHYTARNFAWSVSHMYEVKTEQVGDVIVIGYAFPMHSSAGEMALRTTVESLKLYEDLFGPYPHKTLSVVEADFLDGMEYDGLYFLSNGFYNLYTGYQGEYLVAIAAHETAHQWFYGLVGNDQALEPWLDEALCTYSERLYYENLAPDALDWWYRYRVRYYNPRGWVDGSIYNPEGYRAYRDAVYLNGALFLEDLRTLIGDESFFRFIRAYVSQHSQKLASEDDFFNLIEEYTDQDLSLLIETYFENRP
jgi:hypothetical protein